MKPEIANRILREGGWDADTAYDATQVNCPHCGTALHQCEKKNGSGDWYWSCPDQKCGLDHGGGFRARCAPPK